jgi:hypothetical protein
MELLPVPRPRPQRLSSAKLLEAGKSHLDSGNPLLASHALGDAWAVAQKEASEEGAGQPGGENVAVETFRQLLRADVLMMAAFGDQSRATQVLFVCVFLWGGGVGELKSLSYPQGGSR